MFPFDGRLSIVIKSIIEVFPEPELPIIPIEVLQKLKNLMILRYKN